MDEGAPGSLPEPLRVARGRRYFVTTILRVTVSVPSRRTAIQSGPLDEELSKALGGRVGRFARTVRRLRSGFQPLKWGMTSFAKRSSDAIDSASDRSPHAKEPMK